MRRTFRRRRLQQQIAKPKFRINMMIRVPEIRLIDEQGENVGVFSTQEALKKAQGLGLDLVEVFPTATPPVAKIINYGNFKYQLEKKERKQKQKVKRVEVKGIRLSIGIGAHDKTMRKEQAQEFLEAGDKIKIEIVLRGRERRNTDVAKEVIEDFIKDLGDGVSIDQPVNRQGARLSAMIGKK